MNPNLKWYNSIKPIHRKKMIANIANEILDGKVISCQLLAFLPGLRNAYEKTTSIIEDGKLKTLVQNLHSGTPASTNKEQGKEITHENLRQLKSLSLNRKVNVNILNHKVLGSNSIGEGPFYDKIYSLDDNAVKVTGSPLNNFRKGPKSGKDHIVFKKYLSKLGNELTQTKPDIVNIYDYLKSNKSSKIPSNAKDELNLLEKSGDQELSNILKVALDAKSLLNSGGENLKTNQNKNLNISSLMVILQTSALSDGAVLNKLTPKLANEFSTRAESCKSGKDRTGYQQLHNSHLAVSAYLGHHELNESANKIFYSLACSNHAQHMAAKQGGALGAEGLKKSTVFTPSKYIKIDERILNPNTANYNSVIKTKKQKKGKDSEKFFQDFQAPDNMLLNTEFTKPEEILANNSNSPRIKDQLKITKNPNAQNKIVEEHINSSKEFLSEFEDELDTINWERKSATEVSSEITDDFGEKICDLKEKIIKTQNQKITNSKNEELSINEYRTIDFPLILDQKVDADFAIAAKDSKGENIELDKALYFTANYKNGQLTGLTTPPLKFSSKDKDAFAYIEYKNEIYTMPVTKGKYESMLKNIEKNKTQDIKKDKLRLQAEALGKDLKKHFANSESNQKVNSAIPRIPKKPLSRGGR